MKRCLLNDQNFQNGSEMIRMDIEMTQCCLLQSCIPSPYTKPINFRGKPFKSINIQYQFRTSSNHYDIKTTGEDNMKF